MVNRGIEGLLMTARPRGSFSRFVSPIFTPSFVYSALCFRVLVHPVPERAPPTQLLALRAIAKIAVWSRSSINSVLSPGR